MFRTDLSMVDRFLLIYAIAFMAMGVAAIVLAIAHRCSKGRTTWWLINQLCSMYQETRR